MKVLIISKFNCQSFPLNDKAIEVSEEILNEIGKTKCFDIENNCVIDYDNSNDLKKQEKQKQIAELKQKLAKTDYKAIKFAEGLISAEDYAEIKAERQKWRDEINKLESGGNE